MSNNNLVNKDINNLSFKNIRVLNVYRIEDYYVLTLENNQKIVTNGYKIYDISGYKALYNIFEINDKLCAVLNKASKTYVVDLKTMDILLENGLASTAYKLDDKVIEVMMKINAGETRLYNIETKDFLPTPTNYKFMDLIGEHQYVFKEIAPDKDDLECKRCIMNADGEIVFNNIVGHIEICDDKFVISKKDELDIVKKDENGNLQINSLNKNDIILAPPIFYKGQIYIIEKGLVKVLTPDLELVKQYEIKEMNNIFDYEVENNILKLCLPHTINDEEIPYYLFLNMHNGKNISHSYIDGFPYWNPKVYVGVENLGFINDDNGNDHEYNEFNFYDSEFNKICTVKGNSFCEIDGDIFTVTTWDGNKYKETFINAETKVVKDSNYDSIEFLSDSIYGSAFNQETDMMDLVDRDLNVIFANIDYKTLDLGRNNSIFGGIRFYVVNNYACIKKQVYNYEHTYIRNIIIDSNGEIVLDSMEHTCTPMGFYIQITKDGESEYLNTLTGEKGELSINVFVKNNGSIDLDGIEYVKNIFQIDAKPQDVISDKQLKKEYNLHS